MELVTQRTMRVLLACVRVAGLLMLTVPGGLAQNRLTPAGGAAASCSVSVGSSSNVTETDAFAENVVEISSFVCGEADDGDGSIEINTQAAALASAVAEAVSEINYTCSLQGSATASIEARGAVEARARAVGTAVAEVVEGASVCGDCAARVTSFVRQTQEVIAVASVESFVSLNFTSTPGRPIEETRRIFRRSVESNVQEAIASVSVAVRRTPTSEFGCEVTGSTTAQVGESFTTCNFSAIGTARVVEEDAIASIGAEVRAFVCKDGDAEDAFEATLTATAKALVEAVAQVDVACESQGDTESAGCAMGESTIRATAKATAEAFVMGLVEAGTCFCNESVTVNASAFEEVFAEASAAAFAETCLSGPGTSFITVFQRQVEEELIAAVAQLQLAAEALATGDSGECLITNDSGCAGATQCARDHEQCRGDEVPDGVILPCCSAAFVCTRRSSADSRCQRAGEKLPRFYEGTIEPPTAEQPSCP